MRTTEPERWQALLDQTAVLSPKTLEQFRDQKTFALLGQRVDWFQDKKRYCTVEGLNQQLDDFELRVGLVYYIDEANWSMAKTAFEKTREEHYGTN